MRLCLASLRHVITLLAKSVLIPPSLTAALSSATKRIHKKILVSEDPRINASRLEKTTLISSNEEMENKIEIVNCLEDSSNS